MVLSAQTQNGNLRKKFKSLYTSNQSPKLLWNNSRIKLKFEGRFLKQEDKAPFTPNNVVNLLIVYELHRWSRNLNADYTLKDCLFEAFKITKNADLGKSVYTGYGNGFDSRSEFLFPDVSMGKNVTIFGVDMSSSVHIDNKEKDILIFGIGLTQELDHPTLTAVAQYSNFSRSNRTFCLRLHGNGNNSFLSVSAAEINKIKEKKI